MLHLQPRKTDEKQPKRLTLHCIQQNWKKNKQKICEEILVGSFWQTWARFKFHQRVLNSASLANTQVFLRTKRLLVRTGLLQLKALKL